MSLGTGGQPDVPLTADELNAMSRERRLAEIASELESVEAMM